MEECIFCRIAKGGIPSSKVLEDENFLAFLDINPINKGHLLVIPKKHYGCFLDFPQDQLGPFFAFSQKAAKALIVTTKCDGFNLAMNNGRAAAQLVPHAHLHIMPRFTGDGFAFDWPTKKYEEGEMDRLAKRISSYVKK
ncbi:MAG: HIT family protein [Candidatus Micrarchaeota archaeon]|nr:HIT family protein [Candidatus Micrarchaeota archaeon]